MEESFQALYIYEYSFNTYLEITIGTVLRLLCILTHAILKELYEIIRSTLRMRKLTHVEIW